MSTAEARKTCLVASWVNHVATPCLYETVSLTMMNVDLFIRTARHHRACISRYSREPKLPLVYVRNLSCWALNDLFSDKAPSLLDPLGMQKLGKSSRQLDDSLLALRQNGFYYEVTVLTWEIRQI